MHQGLRLISILTLCLLTACGGGTKRIDGIPPAFSDRKPHAWRGTAPIDFPVHGVDVSRWQGDIDWRRVAGAGVAFAFIKATEGGDVADPMFLDNWAATRRAGIPRGAYHFYYLCRPAIEQARWYIDHVPRTAGALPPVLDIEWNHQSRTCRIRPDPAHIREEIRTFQRVVGAHYGQRPIIYTTVDFYADNGLSELRGEEFWLRSVAGHPHGKFPGQRWSFWQYTGTGIVPGIDGDADINAFEGSATDWARWLARRRQ